MSGVVIRGKYRVKGRSPDGDSIGFQADNQLVWDLFQWKTPGKKPKPGSNKAVQLRIEGIDTLETHYEGYGQPKAVAKAATHHLLSAFGVEALTYSLNFTLIVDAKDEVPGTIVTKGLDGNDRPIAYALLGDHPFKDGDTIDMSDELIRASVNYQLAVEGLAYPTFYNDTEEVGIAVLSSAARQARDAKRGIWAFDRTPGFTFWGPQTIYEDVVILPKLFRRLVGFCEKFDSWDELAPYAKESDDPFTVISTGEHFRKLADLLRIEDRLIGLKYDPIDLRFGNKIPTTPVAPLSA